MGWLLRTLGRRALVALAVACAALGAHPALAEIFKCSAKDGTPLYQNFPCNVDSLGSMPSQPTATATHAVAPASTHEKPNGKPAERSASVATPVVQPIGTSGLQVGMTEAQVQSIMGEPDERLEDEPRSGRVYIWRYGNREYVMFDVKRHVISVEPYASQQ
jgi:hypothetical protein